MIDGKFDVVFRGQIVKSFELPTVKANMVKLFKSSPEAVERLFSGNEVIIRKDLDYAAAMKYQSALKNAGALALIKEITEAEPLAKPAASAPADNANHPQSEEPALNNSVKEDPGVSDDLSIADVGAQILPPKTYQQREVDTSELSLATAGEKILPDKLPKDHPKPKTDHLSLDDDY